MRLLEFGEPPLRRVAAAALQVGILLLQAAGHLVLVVRLLRPGCARRLRQALVHVVRHRQPRHRLAHIHHVALPGGQGFGGELQAGGGTVHAVPLGIQRIALAARVLPACRAVDPRNVPQAQRTVQVVALQLRLDPACGVVQG